MAPKIDFALSYYIGVVALLLLPTLGLLGVSIGAVKTRKDPARCGFAWFLATLVVFAIGQILALARYALQLSLINRSSSTYSTYGDMQIIRHLTPAMVFCSDLASATLLITIGTLAAGVHEVATGASPKFVRPLTYGFGAIVAILSFTVFVGWEMFYGQRGWSPESTRKAIVDLQAMSNVDGAAKVVAFAAALTLAGIAIFVRFRSAKGPGAAFKRVGTLLLAVAIGYLVLRSWDIWRAITSFTYVSISTEWYMADVIINRWGTFAMLVIIFVMGRKKEGGIWSVPTVERKTVEEA